MRIPVLAYHRVGPLAASREWQCLTVSPLVFETHMKWLAEHGYHCVRPSDVLAWRKQQVTLPDKSVLITFDDAYADTAKYALPVVHTHGLTAAIFVVTGQVGKTNAWDENVGYASHELMTADQIRYWAGCGFEFGSHGRTHSPLTMLNEDALMKEVAASAEELVSILGNRVSAFAYAYGLSNKRVRNLVSTKFDLAFGCKGGMNTRSTDLYSLKRTIVRPDDTVVRLASRLRFGYIPLEVPCDGTWFGAHLRRLMSSVRNSVNRG